MLAGNRYLLLCETQRVPVCLDVLCTERGQLEDCGGLKTASALVDLVVVALLLLFLLLDRIHRPRLVRLWTSATTEPNGKGEKQQSSGEGEGDERDEEQGGSSSSSRRRRLRRTGGSSKVGVERYSVWVTNPPPDLVNPDVWKEYFEKNFGEVRGGYC